MAVDAPDLRRRLRRAWRQVRGHLPDLRHAPAILMYHRVAEPPWDPWGMCVPPALFRRQVRALKARRTLVSMDALAAGLESGALPPRAIALTFDDGYADNVLAAKPILEELEAPATLLLTSGFVASGRRFWWDELARLVLAGREAADFSLVVGGTRLAAAWPDQVALPVDLAAWRIGDATMDPRRLAYVRLWRTLQPMHGGEREGAMAALAAELGGAEPLGEDALGRPMTPEMARGAPSRLVALGVHGRSHTPLTALPPAERREELHSARAEIAAMTGAGPPSGLAYPHGSVDAETRALAAEAGYRWAVTSRSARVDPRRFDLLALPRLEAGRQDAREILQAVHVSGR